MMSELSLSSWLHFL